MKFVDEAHLLVRAGKGGDGSIAFRREKYVPLGGPAGGDGGRGGSIILVADEGRTSLLDLAHMRHRFAKDGEHGRGKDQYGRAGADLEVRVPVGTEVYLEDGGDKLADLTYHGQRFVVAEGGQGGRGNIHFATPYDRAPHRAEPGTAGQERRIRLELKVLADVGLVGFPNVGKSTLVAAMSHARPKIADYPFTTLRPHLGVVQLGGRASTASFVLADIPGLIPGASAGVGLGTRFLKHVERCRALLHLLAPPTDQLAGEGRDPLRDFDALCHELRTFAPELAERPQVVALSKADLPDTQQAYLTEKKRFAKRGITLHLVSAATGEGLSELAAVLYQVLRGRRPEDDDAEQTPPRPARSTPVASKADEAAAPTRQPAKAHAPREAAGQSPPPAARKVAGAKASAHGSGTAEVRTKTNVKAKRTVQAKATVKPQSKAKAKTTVKPKAKARPTVKPKGEATAGRAKAAGKQSSKVEARRGKAGSGGGSASKAAARSGATAKKQRTATSSARAKVTEPRNGTARRAPHKRAGTKRRSTKSGKAR